MKKDTTLGAYRILAIVLIVLGVIHCLMVFVYYESLTHEALYSIGTGIAVIILGLLNYSAAKLLSPILLTVAIIANTIQTLYGFLSLRLINGLPTYLGILTFLLSLVLSWIVKKRTTDS